MEPFERTGQKQRRKEERLFRGTRTGICRQTIGVLRLIGLNVFPFLHFEAFSVFADVNNLTGFRALKEGRLYRYEFVTWPNSLCIS